VYPTPLKSPLRQAWVAAAWDREWPTWRDDRVQWEYPGVNHILESRWATLVSDEPAGEAWTSSLGFSLADMAGGRLELETAAIRAEVGEPQLLSCCGRPAGMSCIVGPVGEVQ
jgi:hypothetical protein